MGSACSVGWWLMLVCSERRVLLAGCWFVLREKYCWLVADKPSEQGGPLFAKLIVVRILCWRIIHAKILTLGSVFAVQI
jgi:hypothetical protein